MNLKPEMLKALAYGEIVVKNDPEHRNIQLLTIILRAAFPSDHTTPWGSSMFYGKNTSSSNPRWSVRNENNWNVPAHPLTDFIESESPKIETELPKAVRLKERQYARAAAEILASGDKDIASGMIDTMTEWFIAGVPNKTPEAIAALNKAGVMHWFEEIK